MKDFLYKKVYDPLDSGIVKWLYSDAKWYQFWNPGSGFIGGLIASSIAVTIVFGIFMFLARLV